MLGQCSGSTARVDHLGAHPLDLDRERAGGRGVAPPLLKVADVGVEEDLAHRVRWAGRPGLPPPPPPPGYPAQSHFARVLEALLAGQLAALVPGVGWDSRELLCSDDPATTPGVGRRGEVGIKLAY